jgi:cyclic beta-1,2-glucan synthetase
MALAMQGRADEAWKCLGLLNPINHGATREAIETYRVEPYVVAADVYGEGNRKGRGGWTWYTGSAGWLYRAAVEGILGIRKEAGRLKVDPVMPSGWEGFSAVVTLDGVAHAIRANRSGNGEIVVNIDETVIKTPQEEYSL